MLRRQNTHTEREEEMGNKEEITLRFRDRAQVKKKHGEKL